MSDEEIKQDALDNVYRAFGKPEEEPEFVHLFHYDKGLNIAKPGSYGKLDAVRNEMPKGVFLAGDSSLKPVLKQRSSVVSAPQFS
ncbi:MAG: hypothetical protein R3E73_06230 [Porticoccaceae bacterium]